MSHVLTTTFSNCSRVHPTNINYFQESPYRQYGSGIGAAIETGFRGFLIPMVKRYGIPVAKSFLQQSAPEVLNILDGSTKPTTAKKNAVKKTIRQQIGGGRERTKKKERAAKKSGKQYYRKKTNSEKESGKCCIKIKENIQKEAFTQISCISSPAIENKGKKRSRQDFFASIVDHA